MNKKNQKRLQMLKDSYRHHKKGLFITVLVIFALVICVPQVDALIHPKHYIACSGDTLEVTVSYYAKNDEAGQRVVSIPRGSEVELRELGEKTSTIVYKNETLTVDNDHLVDNLEDAIQIKYVYPRRLLNLLINKQGKLSDMVVRKGEKVKVVSVKTEDLDRKTGRIQWYQVKKNGKKYWINGAHVETTKSAATANYAQDITYSTYWDDYYGKGYSKDAYVDQIDYKPQPASRYADNPIRTDINSVHVSLSNLKNHKKYYLSLIKKTGINSITIECKGDGGNLFYDSDVPKKYLSKPSEALTGSVMSKQELKDLIHEFQDAGYYMIARCVTFKDSIFAKQNKKEAIVDKKGNFIEINDEYWPSIYSRKAWMYNVDICKEIAQMGINEIQFDYCRFPDGTASQKDDLNMRNTYNESKAAAIQGFFTYAKDQISPYHVYVAADVFAWPIVVQDDQDIGQFFPAIANVVDVVCPMPYTDLFSQGAMDIADPTAVPKKTLYKFSTIAKRQMDEIGTQAIYRTWIQAYSPFDASDVKAEIKGINKAGFEGYLIWFGNGDPNDLKGVQKGFVDSKIKN